MCCYSLVVGDWGREGSANQTACAAAMAATAATLRAELSVDSSGVGASAGGSGNGNYLGVVSTGDNFYPVWLYKLTNSVDLQLESNWFQPLNS